MGMPKVEVPRRLCVHDMAVPGQELIVPVLDPYQLCPGQGELLVFLVEPMRSSKINWLVQGLRIEEEVLNQVSGAELRTLKPVYKHQRVQRFITELEIVLGLELDHD